MFWIARGQAEAAARMALLHATLRFLRGVAAQKREREAQEMLRGASVAEALYVLAAVRLSSGTLSPSSCRRSVPPSG